MILCSVHSMAETVLYVFLAADCVCTHELSTREAQENKMGNRQIINGTPQEIHRGAETVACVQAKLYVCRGRL
jgi:hypothetical protein